MDKDMPPPRRFQRAVEVELTTLETPNLPAREKREAEIRLLKGKSNALLKDEESKLTEERHPEFLKLKGDEFFKQRNYRCINPSRKRDEKYLFCRSAIHAYTRAVDIDSDLHLVLSNRAACYLALNQWELCVEDCHRALTILEQRIQSSSIFRKLLETLCSRKDGDDLLDLHRLGSRIYCRSGAANAHLKRHNDALNDFTAALKWIHFVFFESS